MLKIKTILCLILILVIPIGLFAGCGNKTDDAYIYFELPAIPYTLDPQTASSDSELLIIKNIYEGLLRKDENGKIVNGSVESFSKKGLTYTFKIRSDANWSNDDPVTAHDYVFAFRRAIDPKTKAPFAKRLFSIKNAKKINVGEMSSDKLGVKALDDKTLQITLAQKDKDFENTLTTSVAMPCNEKLFYESEGKYGLFRDYIISNGSYRLTKWNKTSFGIRLYRHEEYTGDFYAKNAAIFLTCNDNEPITEKLKKNSIDIAFIDSANSEEIKTAGLNTRDYQNICWVLTIKNDFSFNMRKALALLVGDDIYSQSLKSGYTVASSIFPSVISENSPANGKIIYNLEAGKDLYLSEINKLENKKFPSDVILYYYDDGYSKSIVTDIVGHWQNNLSAFVNIESASDSALLVPELKEQTLSMSIFPIRADNDNTSEYLQKFGFDYNGEKLGNIQNNILEDCTVIPLAFQNTCIAYSPAITNFITTAGNGYIDFSFIIKVE